MGERELAAERNEADAEVERLRTVNAALLELIERGYWKLHTFVHIYTGDKELRRLLADWDAALAKGEKP